MAPTGEALSRRCVRCALGGGLEATARRPYYCPRKPQAGGEPTHDSLGAETGAEEANGAAPPRYRLVEELGRGGMGAVFRAKDLELGREVALKLLPPASRDDRRERFLEEARLLASVEDPGVVRLYDAGQTRMGGLWIAMAWVRGPTLEDVLHDAGSLPVAEATRIAREVAATLGRLHQRGVCHRDLKPANILLTTEGQPMLTDFGLAIRIDEEGAVSPGAGIPGTRAYMAPELLAPGAAPDWRRADVYALGVVLERMLVGQVPRGDQGPPSGEDAAARLAHVGARGLASVLRVALDPDPHRRFADGAAFAEALAGAAGPVPAGLRRAPVVGWGGVAAVALAVCVTLVGSGVWGRWREGRADDAREAAASARLEATWARRGELLADGDAREASATFEDFIGLDENRGTRAWAEAWQRLAAEQRAAGAPEAAASYGQALVASTTGPTRRAAAAGLLATYREAGRWPQARALVEFLQQDADLAELVSTDVRVEVALANRELAAAADALDGDDPRRRLLQRLGVAEPVAAGVEEVDRTPCRRPDELSRATVDGLTVVGTLGYDRGLFRLSEPGCRWHPFELPGGRDDAWVQGLASLDADADGLDDLILGLGPPEGYAVAVHRGAGGARLEPGASRVLGNVEAVGGWKRRSGPPLVLAATSGRHPSRRVFPDAPHRGEAPGLHLLRWADGVLELATSFASPAWNGEPLVPINLVTVDLDQDGGDDVLIGAAEWVGVLLQAEPQPPPLWIGGMRLVSVVQDGPSPPRVRVRIDGEDWLLGAGAGRLPRASAPAPLPLPPAGDEAWARATQLGTLGLYDASAEAFAQLGRTRSGEERAAAWRAAADVRGRTDPLAAAFIDLEAARAGWTGGWARAASAFATHLQAEALREVLAEAPRARLPEADRAVIAALEAEHVEHPPSTLPMSGSAAAWSLRAPFAAWDPKGGIGLRLVTGVGPVARIALQRTGGRVGLRLRARIVHQEWGSGFAVTLGTEGGTLTAFERRAGDSVAHRREVGLEPAPWFDVPGGAVDTPHEFELILAPTPGEMNHVVLVPSWDGVRAAPRLVGGLGDFDGDVWMLELAARGEGQLRGPMTDLTVESIELWGLRPTAGTPAYPEPAGDAEAVGRLRVSPAEGLQELLASRGLAETLALVTDAWEEAMEEPVVAPRTRAALLAGLGSLDAARADPLAPLLAGWRGRLLVQEGRLAEAEAAFRSAASGAGARGHACFEAHAGLGAVATARGEAAEPERARAAACLGGGRPAERALVALDLRPGYAAR